MAAHDLGVLEQAHVARQQNAAFSGGESGERFIRVIAGVERIEAEEPKPPRELSQMHVRDKTRAPQGARPQAVQRPDIEALEHRVHRNSLAPLKVVREAHGASVDQDQVHFGVRDSERLDDVFHRRRALEDMNECAPATRRWQEVVQLLVETEFSRVLHVPSSETDSE